MTIESRQKGVISSHSTLKRQIEYPKHENGKAKYPSEFYGERVFTLEEMAKYLPKPVFGKFIKQVRGRRTMDKEVADAIAHAVRVWSMDRGATHFTHFFQPQTGSTAEKHDSFLSLKSTIGQTGEEIFAVDQFSGSQLLQSEPDASSFPNGGMRTTFEARGYTIWDCASPMFIQPGPHDTSILYIPSIFISYNGEVLDEKTVLLRAGEALSRNACQLLSLIDIKTPRVYTTLGCEQEYFLIDRSLYTLRPDLRLTGRTLLGARPPKGQQLEDHYFGRIPSRVLAMMSESEMELYKLGVPVKTRHNEVAPAQFEMAPIFEESAIAVDHNLIAMDSMHTTSHKYNLKVLFHEKPFKGVNGSGKHCNFSMSTEDGLNLLDPGANPETNYPFLMFLVATMHAVHEHGGLLRASIASSSNEHRLGANEAPPGIISCFLGSQLNEVLDAIEQQRPLKKQEYQMHTIKIGGTVLDMKVATLPEINRDLTDRNRTSPMAFTGNKFEFRAVGSKQTPSFPVALLSTAVAASIQLFYTELKASMKGSAATEQELLALLRKYIKSTRAVRFEGNGYSDAWKIEAVKRGLLNIDNCVDAFDQLITAKTIGIFEQQGVLTKEELHSRYHIMLERYVKDLIIEGNCLVNMIKQQVIPSVLQYKKQVADTGNAVKNIGGDVETELGLVQLISKHLKPLSKNAEKLEKVVDGISEEVDPRKAGVACKTDLLPLMDLIREDADLLEEIVDDKLWPYPKYIEMLY